MLSHHDILYAIVQNSAEITPPECKMIREFDKIDIKQLELEALKIDWSEADQIPLDDRVANFNNKLIELFDTVSPLKIIKHAKKFKPKLPWCEREIQPRNMLRASAALTPLVFSKCCATESNSSFSTSTSQLYSAVWKN
jgi:hypothetical protein